MTHTPKTMSLKRAMMGALGSTAIGLFLATSAIGQTQQPSSPQAAPAAQGQPAQNSMQQSLEKLAQVRAQFETQPDAQAAQTARQQGLQALTEVERLIQPAGQANGQPSDTQAHQKAQASITEARRLMGQANAQPAQVAMALERVETDVKAARPSLAAADGQTDRTQVQVNQPSAQVDVQQHSPNVNVEQPAPNVNVTQPAPNIKVEQPPAKVTVQQPEPQVTVQQQDPKVSVQQAEPQVSVQQPDPQVTVQQPDPNVTVEQAEPRVVVEQQGSADVTVQQQSEAQVQRDRTDPATTASTDRQSSQISQMGTEMVGRTIYGSNGEEIGDVEELVTNAGNPKSVLVDVGGFLGIGAKRVAINVDNLQMQGDRIVTSMTREQVEDLPAHADN